MIKGKVILAGAGPGDPELIGDRALQCIKQADAIVYDRLVSPRLVALARTDAELVYVGKASSQHTMRQEEINALLVHLAKQNKSVLRLKGGDPFVFGRGGEEALHLRENGVEFEIIPGITSAIAVAAYAGIPVTHRGIATSFAVVTGHEDPDKIDSGMQWDKLSTAVDTLVFLMGVENLPHITSQLLTHGRPADTPAAVIRWGTTPKQKTLVTTVGKAVADVAAAGMTPPAIFVVGQVVSLREGLRWFDIRPLFGQRILVTRAREQASRLTEELEAAGAMCLEAPTIRLTDPDSYEPLDNAIRSINQYSWVAFTSPNGVKSFFARLKLQGKDARHLGQIKLAVIGPETAAALERQGIVPDVVPAEFRAEAVVAALTGKVGPQDRVLIARAAEAREVLPQELIRLGAAVDVVAAYKTVQGEAEGALISQQMLAGEIDIVTFTSSSTVTNLLKILGDNAQELLAGIKIACIGPITADTCKENGLIPDVVATEYTIKGLVDSIIREMGEAVMTEILYRPRRLRATAGIRNMVRETQLSVHDFVYPIFVVPGINIRKEIPSLPGQYHLSADQALETARRAAALGIPAVLLFGLPEYKDAKGSSAWDMKSPVQRTMSLIKKALPELMVIGDVCLCEYTDHGHCGLLKGQEVDNDPTLDLLARVAVSQAKAGADIIAPSDMMDGRVSAIREALDVEGFASRAIMAYSAKYASAFYGPFREAADSAPKFGDRRAYQMDPANVREALREVDLDVSEGADIIMVKPAMAYMDVISKVRDGFELPVAAYNVSGEYAMVKAAAANGWIEEQRTTLEILTGIKRAGAQIIITYHALEAAEWL